MQNSGKFYMSRVKICRRFNVSTREEMAPTLVPWAIFFVAEVMNVDVQE